MIDAHHHLWDLAAREHRWLMGGQPWATDAELARLRRSFTLADLAPLTAACGVTGTVVVQTVTEPWETPDLLALAEAGGLLAGVVGWTDLTAPVSRTRWPACVRRRAARSCAASGIRPWSSPIRAGWLVGRCSTACARWPRRA